MTPRAEPSVRVVVKVRGLPPLIPESDLPPELAMDLFVDRIGDYLWAVRPEPEDTR